jgi:hypothetical protein
MNRTLGAFRPGSHPDHGDIGVVRFKSFEPFSRCQRLIIEASLSFTPTRKPRFPPRGFRFCALHQRTKLSKRHREQAWFVLRLTSRTNTTPVLETSYPNNGLSHTSLSSAVYAS